MSIPAKEIKSEILINAAPSKVWSVLMDFEGYPQWNPFIKHIKGEAKEGEKIKVRIEPPGAMGMNFTPRILNVDENRELRWLGHFIFPGLFDGQHIFELIDNKDNTTTFIQREKFRGILVPLFKKIIEVNTLQGFVLMNNALKIKAGQ